MIVLLVLFAADLNENAITNEILAPKYNVSPDYVDYRLWDGTRVDMLNDTYAWEVDWARSDKWAEAIGQSLYYAQVTGRKPGIILIIKQQSEERYVYRCAVICAKVGIELCVEKYSDLVD